MKSITDRFSDALKGRKEPGLKEITSLLNFDETPVALVDYETRSFLFINSRLMNIVSASPRDIYEKDVTYLFPDLDFSTVFSGEIRETQLNRRGLALLRTRVRFDFLDSTGKWVIIRLMPGAMDDQERKLQLEEAFRHLARFVKLSDSQEIAEKIYVGVDIIRELLGCETVCLYQADSSLPQLKRIAVSGNSDDFPKKLPSTDLVKLEKPAIWVTGSRILTELHREARVNNNEYVASAPMLEGGAAFGLLVAAGKGGIPVSLSLDGMELLAAMLLSLFQQQVLVNNLNERIDRALNLINVRNQVFESMNEAVIILDNALIIREVNPAAEYMLGYAAWEVKGQTYENILIGSDRLLPALIDAQKGKETLSIGKASLNRRNGQPFPVLMKVMPVMKGEHVSAIEIMMIDISEHEQSKAVTQQLEHRAVLGDYTAAFAHDVRNPINNISTGLQLLASNLEGDKSSQTVINRMQGDCTRLDHMMESFLAFSRPMELKFEAFEVESFLKRIIDRWQPRLARAGIKSVLHVDAKVEKIIGDTRSLENVFTNLISNALEAMTETGDTLAIKAVLVQEINGHPKVEISISDNGPGIPSDIKNRIFEPFVTTRKLGTGIGLAITKQIVNAHKGSIKVDSFPGGTVFTVQLPADTGDK